MTEGVPEEVDERLWVKLSGRDGTAFPGRAGEIAYLTYNPHTHRGHVAAWFPALGRFLSLNKNDIAEFSPEAELWMAGFLAGNEPEVEQMFGAGMGEANDDDPRWERWRNMPRAL